MLLSGAFITGTGLVVGVRVYQENKSLSRGTREQKEIPCTVYAERVGLIKQRKKTWPFEQQNNWLRADERRTHLNTLSEDDASVEKQQIERQTPPKWY